MPYSSVADLPDRVKSHLPAHAQKIFMNVFNSVLEQTGDETRAFKAAWSKVHANYGSPGNKQWGKDKPFKYEEAKKSEDDMTRDAWSIVKATVADGKVSDLWGEVKKPPMKAVPIVSKPGGWEMELPEWRKDLLNVVKKIPGTQYAADDKLWHIPMSGASVQFVAKLLEDKDFYLIDWIEKEPKPTEGEGKGLTMPKTTTVKRAVKSDDATPEDTDLEKGLGDMVRGAVDKVAGSPAARSPQFGDIFSDTATKRKYRLHTVGKGHVSYHPMDEENVHDTSKSKVSGPYPHNSEYHMTRKEYKAAMRSGDIASEHEPSGTALRAKLGSTDGRSDYYRPAGSKGGGKYEGESYLHLPAGVEKSQDDDTSGEDLVGSLAKSIGYAVADEHHLHHHRHEHHHPDHTQPCPHCGGNGWLYAVPAGEQEPDPDDHDDPDDAPSTATAPAEPLLHSEGAEVTLDKSAGGRACAFCHRNTADGALFTMLPQSGYCNDCLSMAPGRRY